MEGQVLMCARARGVLAPIVNTVRTLGQDFKQVFTAPGKANLGQFLAVGTGQGGFVVANAQNAVKTAEQTTALKGALQFGQTEGEIAALAYGGAQLAGFGASAPIAGPSVGVGAGSPAAPTVAAGAYSSAFAGSDLATSVLPPADALALTPAEADTALGVTPLTSTLGSVASGVSGSGGGLSNGLTTAALLSLLKGGPVSIPGPGGTSIDIPGFFPGGLEGGGGGGYATPTILSSGGVPATIQNVAASPILPMLLAGGLILFLLIKGRVFT